MERNSEDQSFKSKSSSNFLDSKNSSANRKHLKEKQLIFSENSDNLGIAKKTKSHFAQTLPSSGSNSNSRSKDGDRAKSKKSVKSKRKKPKKKKVEEKRMESLDSLRAKFISPIIKQSEFSNHTKEDLEKQTLAKEKFESFSQVVYKNEKMMFDSFLNQHKSEILNKSSKKSKTQENGLNDCNNIYLPILGYLTSKLLKYIYLYIYLAI